MRLLRLVALAGAPCLAVAVLPAPAPALTYVYTGIRPGTHLTTSTVALQSPRASCTASFVFQDTPGVFNSSDTHYIGTAGHCDGFVEGATIRALVVPPGGTTAIFTTVGTVERNFRPADDFALIRIADSANALVSPSMALWGGPTGVHPDATGSGVAARWVGHGGYVGAAVPRVGTATWTTTELTVRDTVDLIGDSGAGVISSDGYAIGSLVGVRDLGPIGSVGHPAGTTAEGPSIALMLTLSGKALSVCSSAVPWRDAGCPPS